MLNATGGSIWRAVIRYIQNGDALNTSNFLAMIQDVADCLTYLKAGVDDDYTHAGDHTFTEKIIHSGAGGRTVFRFDDSHRAGGGLASFTADVSKDSYEIGGNPSGADFVITMRSSTSPVPADGERITIFKTNGSNNVTNVWKVKLESTTTLATFPVGSAFGSVTMICGQGNWRVESISGAVTVP